MAKNGRQLAITIQWHSFVESEETFCFNSLTELATLIGEYASELPRIILHRVDSDLIPSLLRIETYKFGFPGSGMWDTDKYGRLFVFCDQDSQIAREQRRIEPTALWGAADVGTWAIAWKPGNKYLLWHEALHVLGARDCYDLPRKTCSDRKDCLMQYVPNELNCGGKLCLCSKIISDVCRSGFGGET